MQLIDTLQLGGAEKLAVSLSNVLARDLSSSIGVTREDGPLSSLVQKPTKLFFFRKRHTLDIVSYWRLIQAIKKDNIRIIHAHGPSLFMAVIAKCFTKIGIVWHIHHGNYTKYPAKLSTRILSRFADHIITVNHDLQRWTVEELNFEKSDVSYLPNFVDSELEKASAGHDRKIPGKKGSRILCIANFRPEKNHLNLLEAFQIFRRNTPDSSLILVGKSSDDEYSQQINQYIMSNDLSNCVHILGSFPGVRDIMKQCDVGVISSDSEGLPMVLLEYGITGLPVISTSVGQCPEVLGNGQHGLLVPPNDPKRLSESIKQYFTHLQLAKEKGLSFQKHVELNYTSESVRSSLMRIYQKVVE